MTNKTKNIATKVVDRIITCALVTVTKKLIRRKSKKRRGRPGKADRITWEGEDPEILFKNAATVRTPESKMKLGEYITFVYENTTCLPSRGLKLVADPINARNMPENIANVSIKCIKTGSIRPFYINMSGKKGAYTFREVGENLLSICLTIIQSILSNTQLNENTKAWSFTIQDNKIDAGSLSYSLGGNRVKQIDLTKEEFWDDAGEFIGERAIASLHVDTAPQDFQNLPPIWTRLRGRRLHRLSHCENVEKAPLARGTSVANAVESTRDHSFAQINVWRSTSML